MNDIYHESYNKISIKTFHIKKKTTMSFLIKTHSKST